MKNNSLVKFVSLVSLASISNSGITFYPADSYKYYSIKLGPYRETYNKYHEGIYNKYYKPLDNKWNMLNNKKTLYAWSFKN